MYLLVRLKDAQPIVFNSNLLHHAIPYNTGPGIFFITKEQYKSDCCTEFTIITNW